MMFWTTEVWNVQMNEGYITLVKNQDKHQDWKKKIKNHPLGKSTKSRGTDYEKNIYQNRLSFVRFF